MPQSSGRRSFGSRGSASSASAVCGGNSRFAALGVGELRAEAGRLGVDLSACVEKEEMVRKLAGAQEAGEDEPSEIVSQWTKPQMKGWLLKDAVQSRANTKQRYFVLMGSFLLYYESSKDSVYHPKGVWCLDDCKRAGFMKRPGLGETQACLLRGNRELVITASSTDELKRWNRAVQEARKFSVASQVALERRSSEEHAKLHAQFDSALVELETLRSRLRSEREVRARLELDDAWRVGDRRPK